MKSLIKYVETTPNQFAAAPQPPLHSLLSARRARLWRASGFAGPFEKLFFVVMYYVYVYGKVVWIFH